MRTFGVRAIQFSVRDMRFLVRLIANGSPNSSPGSTVGAATTANSISLIAESINRAHKETKYVTTVLENMVVSNYLWF